MWSLVIRKKRVGPMSPDEVRRLFETGEITPRTYAWRRGFKRWIRLEDVPEFADLGAAPPASKEPEPAAEPPEEASHRRTPIQPRTPTQPMFRLSNPDDLAELEQTLHHPPASGRDRAAETEELASFEDPGDDRTIPMPWPPDDMAASDEDEAGSGSEDPAPATREAEEEDPNAVTSRWEQDRVDAVLRTAAAPSTVSSSTMASSTPTSEIRLKDDLDELFGRRPTEPPPEARPAMGRPAEPALAPKIEQKLDPIQIPQPKANTPIPATVVPARTAPLHLADEAPPDVQAGLSTEASLSLTPIPTGDPAPTGPAAVPGNGTPAQSAAFTPSPLVRTLTPRPAPAPEAVADDSAPLKSTLDAAVAASEPRLPEPAPSPHDRPAAREDEPPGARDSLISLAELKAQTEAAGLMPAEAEDSFAGLIPERRSTPEPAAAALSEEEPRLVNKLVGARDEDSVLFSRTQFERLAQSMKSPEPDEGDPSLSDIKPLAASTLGAKLPAEDQALRNLDSGELPGLFSAADLERRRSGPGKGGLGRDAADSSVIDIRPLARTHAEPADHDDFMPLPVVSTAASPLLFPVAESDKPRISVGLVVGIVAGSVVLLLGLLTVGLYALRPDLLSALVSAPPPPTAVATTAPTAAPAPTAQPTSEDPAAPEEPGTRPGAAAKEALPIAAAGPDENRPAKRPAAGRTPRPRGPTPTPAPSPTPAASPHPTVRIIPPPSTAPAGTPRPKAAPTRPPDELDTLVDSALGNEDRPATARPKPTPKAADPDPIAPSEPDRAASDLPEGLTREQMRSGMERASIGVQACRGTMTQGDMVTIQVTVNGKSGRITEGKALGKYAGTEAGSCVAASAKFAARFPKFAGEPVTFQYPYIIK